MIMMTMMMIVVGGESVIMMATMMMMMMTMMRVKKMMIAMKMKEMKMHTKYDPGRFNSMTMCISSVDYVTFDQALT